MVENSHKNEIHRVANQTRIPEIYFFASEVLILGEERLVILGKSIAMQIRVWSIPIEDTGFYSLVPNLCSALVFLHVRSNYLLKTDWRQFSGKILT